MKNTKRFCAVVIAIAILLVSVCTVFAADNTNERSFGRLVLLCGDYYRTFRFEEKTYDDRLECDPESAQELYALINEVYDVMYNEETMSADEVDEYYIALDEAAEKVVLVPQELKYLIDFCEREKNENSYYPSPMWDEFQNKLAVAKEVYEIGETSIDVSNAYWDLLFCYNDICTVNPVEGDVDFDGVVTVMDATLIQNCVAKLCTFNSSQLLTIGESHNDRVNVLSATNLQKAVAKLSYSKISYSLTSLLENPRERLLDSNKLFYRYRDSFMPYNGLNQDNFYQPNVP